MAMANRAFSSFCRSSSAFFLSYGTAQHSMHDIAQRAQRGAAGPGRALLGWAGLAVHVLCCARLEWRVQERLRLARLTLPASLLQGAAAPVTPSPAALAAAL